jgi:hypothetical protein
LASTSLLSNGQRLGCSRRADLIDTVINWLPTMLQRPASQGALSSLFAATSADAVKAGYYGPTGYKEFWGPLGDAIVAPSARDQVVAARLWDVSETLTGVSWPAMTTLYACQAQG